MGKTKRKYIPGEYRPMSPQTKDITGQVFGHWKVLRYNDHPTNTNPGTHWWCECQYCGKVKSVWGHALRAGLSDNCGCERNRKNGGRKFKDLTGMTFGRLTVIGLDRIERCGPGRSRAVWRCHCSCNGPNSNCTVASANLLKGDTKSCGCLAHESSSRIALETATHNDSKTRLYHIWFNMISRCHLPSDTSYYKYGARGITVCDEWRGPDLNGWEKRRAGNPGWMAFKKWAYTPINEGGGGYFDQPKDTPYMDRLSIERKKYRRGYSPENCHFIPMKLQAKNRSNNSCFFDGEEVGIYADICRKHGANLWFISSRRAEGWTANAIVHAMKHPELELHKTRIGYRDKDWYLVMIPNYHADFMTNPGDEDYEES